MTHLVSPSSFRVGKTYPWKSNSINKSALSTNNATTKNGITNLLKFKLRRKRLFVVKSIFILANQQTKINVLFMPRIKLRPKSDNLGSFSKFTLYRSHNWSFYKFNNGVKSYIDERRLKMYRFPRKRHVQINKWIYRRMFRGAISQKYAKNYIVKSGKYSKVKSCSYYYRLNYIKKKRWHKKRKNNFRKGRKFNTKLIRKRKLNFLRKERYKLKLKKRLELNPKLKLKLKLIKRKKFRTRLRNYRINWWRKRLVYNNKHNNFKLSHYLSSVLNERINVRIANVFHYLANKQMIKYRSHQEHFWNRRFRRFRFQYDNYYDIVNSFFVLGLIKNSEHLLLSIIRMMMPRIRKIRRFMYFLDAILKNMPQIQANFSCFRITITGKTQGGTKRTKTFSIGFGHLPYQSLQLEGTTAFVSYPHKFGEFGIKLIMNRTYLKLYKNVTKSWVISKDPSPLAYILEPEKKK